MTFDSALEVIVWEYLSMFEYIIPFECIITYFYYRISYVSVLYLIFGVIYTLLPLYCCLQPKKFRSEQRNHFSIESLFLTLVISFRCFSFNGFFYSIKLVIEFVLALHTIPKYPNPIIEDSSNSVLYLPEKFLKDLSNKHLSTKTWATKRPRRNSIENSSVYVHRL